jgi:hypothetical protein
MKTSFEDADTEVYKLLATLQARNILEFPGLPALDMKPGDPKGEALAIAVVCTKARQEGSISDRWEGRLEAMHAYGIVDLVELRHFIDK